MKLLAILITVLLIQSLSAKKASARQAKEQNPFYYKNYYISKSTLKASYLTSVNFQDGRVGFRKDCNNFSNSYKTVGKKFSVGKNWGSTKKGCPKDQHLLDNAIAKLFDNANNLRFTEPQRVRFFQNKKWLFTVKAVLE